MKQPLSTNKIFFAPLHGLRGIAALYLVVAHLGQYGLFLLPIPHDAIGKVGVWIFFVLSAFLLTTHLCHDLETTSSKVFSLLKYTVHRIFRIYPLFIFSLTIHLIYRDISRIEFIQHLFLIQGRSELWAIPVEFQYYFIMPVIAMSTLYLPRRKVILLLAATLMVALFYGIAQPASVFSNKLNIIPKLAPFLLGSILALLLYKKKPASPQSQPKFVFFTPTACLVMLLITTVLFRCIAKNYISISFAPWLSIAIGASVMGLIYFALQPTAVSTLLGARPLVFLGEISFSVYLLHMFVIRFALSLHGLPIVTKAWLSLGLSVLCAIISYWIIERPGIHIGKKISQKLRTNFPAAFNVIS
ncbi:MAG: acyltransferase [Deltaproteobacteria bacterium]|nr:acyltransferase [Deltaproteobacteria bacterium]